MINHVINIRDVRSICQEGRSTIRVHTRLKTCAVQRTTFGFETTRLTKLICTRQAVKTTLDYLSETNGELYFFLHNYISDHPLPLDGKIDPDAWLVQLASSPLTKVSDPRRSSVSSAAAAEAVMNGTREVSPREVVERVLSLREHIAQEMVEDLGGIKADNSNVMRAALEKTFSEIKLPDIQ